MPKTQEEKKQQEQKRQEVLLKLATQSIYGNNNEAMRLRDVVAIWERVNELMSVTKISNENAVSALNKAVGFGRLYGKGKPIVSFSWSSCLKRITAIVREKCSCCGTLIETADILKDYTEPDAENEFFPDDDTGTCLTDIRKFYHQKEVVMADGSIGKTLVHKSKTYYAMCYACVSKQVEKDAEAGLFKFDDM